MVLMSYFDMGVSGPALQRADGTPSEGNTGEPVLMVPIVAEGAV